MATCKTCGRDNQDLYKFCLGCGGELGGDGGDALSARAGETAPKRVEDPPSNGKVLENDWSCATGATRSRTSSRSRRSAWRPRRPSSASGRFSAARLCPTCGNAVPGEFTFCGQCGTRLEARSSSPASASAPPPPSSSAHARASSPSPGDAVQGRLILIRPDGTEGGVHPLVEGENVIGRGLGSLFDADGYLSPRHAEIVLNAAGGVVRDTGSLNGVYVKLTDEEELVDGDIFRIGQELLRFDEIAAPVPLDDGTDVMGSPNPGYWGGSRSSSGATRTARPSRCSATRSRSAASAATSSSPRTATSRAARARVAARRPLLPRGSRQLERDLRAHTRRARDQAGRRDLDGPAAVPHQLLTRPAPGGDALATSSAPPSRPIPCRGC